MHNAAKKLHSQRGASIIYALLVFLLCAFAGAAALVSAAANAGRYARLEHDQQQYLSAASAARMLKEELCGKTVEMTLRLRQTYDWWYVPRTETGSDGIETTKQDLYVRQVYEFLQGDSDIPIEPSPVPVLGGGTKPYSVPNSAACKFYTYDADGKEIEDKGSLAKKLLEDYVGLAFLSQDVPTFFYGQTNGKGYLPSPYDITDPVQTEEGPSCGTHAPVNAAEKIMDLTVTGDTADAAWADRLGTVNVTFTAYPDYRLHVEIAEEHGDKSLYSTVFELPATVTSDLKTEVRTKDGPKVENKEENLPEDLKPYAHDIESYGRRVTLNTVTVTVQWSPDVISVTRTR